MTRGGIDLASQLVDKLGGFGAVDANRRVVASPRRLR
jgi:hypothetical protein